MVTLLSKLLLLPRIHQDMRKSSHACISYPRYSRMKFDTLVRRLAQKVAFLPLEEALLKSDASLIPEDSHLIWTGSKTQQARDHQKRPYIVQVYRHPFARIKFNNKEQYVHRLVFDKVFGIPPGGA